MPYLPCIQPLFFFPIQTDSCHSTHFQFVESTRCSNTHISCRFIYHVSPVFRFLVCVWKLDLQSFVDVHHRPLAWGHITTRSTGPILFKLSSQLRKLEFACCFVGFMLASNCAQVPAIGTMNDEPNEKHVYKFGGWDGSRMIWVKYNDLSKIVSPNCKGNPGILANCIVVWAWWKLMNYTERSGPGPVSALAGVSWSKGLDRSKVERLDGWYGVELPGFEIYPRYVSVVSKIPPHISSNAHKYTHWYYVYSDYLLFVSIYIYVMPWNCLIKMIWTNMCSKPSRICSEIGFCISKPFHPLQSLLLLLPTFWSWGQEEVLYPIHVAATHGEGAAAWGCLIWMLKWFSGIYQKAPYELGLSQWICIWICCIAVFKESGSELLSNCVGVSFFSGPQRARWCQEVVSRTWGWGKILRLLIDAGGRGRWRCWRLKSHGIAES